MRKRLLTDKDKEELDSSIASLADQVAGLLHVPIEITRISHNVGTREMGDTVTSLIVSWNLNREPVYQELRNKNLDVTSRSKAFTELRITADSTADEKTFTLKVADEREHTDNASTVITFVNGLYWGAVEDGTEIDSTVLQGLDKILQGSKSCEFTIDTPVSMRMVFALPSRLGTPYFTSYGFAVDMYYEKTFEFENHLGYVEDYDVWLSQELVNNVNGAIPIVVT